MKRLTDAEMSYMRSLRSLGLNRELDALVGPAIDKLLANYQEQLEIESYGRVELHRYTEQNAAPTVVDVDGLRNECPICDWDGCKNNGRLHRVGAP